MDDSIKNLQIYSCYADSFEDKQKGRRVKGQKGWRGDFYNLAEHLEYIKNLGFNAIHVLPFFKSPMKDGGFDVSDYYKVREDLGGEKGWQFFRDKARDLNMRVFLDLVLNHVSDDHDWFRKAIHGNDKFRAYFIHLKNPPELIKTLISEGEMYAVYNYNNKIFKKRVIFSHDLEANPHWREGKDGYWYYHSFYSHQLDLNWSNPDLYDEMVKVLKYWASQGCDFRLDAVPYIADNGLKEDHSVKVHKILQNLHSEVKKSLFLLEATQAVGKMEDYFGGEVKRQKLEVKNKESAAYLKKLGSVLSRSQKDKSNSALGYSATREADLLYNFNLMNKLWMAVLTEKAGYIWEAVDKIRNPSTLGEPACAGRSMPTSELIGSSTNLSNDYNKWVRWVNFLRNHDDLMVETSDSSVQDMVYRKLVSKGKGFKQKAVSGRLASLLGSDERRILMGHFLLASLPGVPVMYFGDEIGKENEIPNQVETKASFKSVRDDTNDLKSLSSVLSESKKGDSREIHRGTILDEELKGRRAKGFIKVVAEIFNTRLEYVDWINSEPKRLDVAEGVLGIEYGSGLRVKGNNGEKVKEKIIKRYNTDIYCKLIILVNLTDDENIYTLSKVSEEGLSINGGQIKKNKLILPPYAGLWLRVC